MSHRMLLTMLGASVMLGACAESTGPPLDEVADRALHHLRWEQTEAPLRFIATWEFGGEGPVLAPGLVSSGVELAQYEATFWAVSGERRGIQIDYAADGGNSGAFLAFTVDKHSLLLRPDGTPFASGDSVAITVTVDSAEFVVRFEPTGLVFSDTKPAVLQIWYDGADDDLNGDGAVDGEDDRIEQDLLGVWYQGQTDDPWTSMGTVHSVNDKWFEVDLLHFSGYAVSW